MYNNILNGLYDNNSVTTEDEKAKYLQSLQQTVRDLRRDFRNYPVNVDYTNKQNQEGYLLCYVPHYTDLLFLVLKETGRKFLEENINDLMFFGSGPCPEILGYLRYFKQFGPQIPREINLIVWDISIKEWQASRNIIFENVVPEYLNGFTINRRKGTLDISKKFDHGDDGKKRLIVFQNCLNEITENGHNAIIENIRNVFNLSASGSYLAIIDLDFWQVEELIQKIERDIKTKFDCEVIRSIESGAVEHRTTQTNEPRIILDNLLIDIPGQTATGLLYKRKNNFIFTLIKKK